MKNMDLDGGEKHYFPFLASLNLSHIENITTLNFSKKIPWRKWFPTGKRKGQELQLAMSGSILPFFIVQLFVTERKIDILDSEQNLERDDREFIPRTSCI